MWLTRKVHHGTLQTYLSGASMSEYLDAAEIVIRRVGHPLHAREIIDRAFEWGVLTDKTAGLTPHKTMQARLSEHIVKQGANAIFVRLRPGVFFLRDLLTTNPDLARIAEMFRSRPRVPPAPEERVLCVRQDVFGRLDRFQGINDKWQKLHKRITEGEKLYIPRIFAEDDNDHKQIVTYAVIERNGKILSFTRGQFNRAASFLKGANCIGFGGHVTEADLTLFDYSDGGIFNNVAREISEEIHLPQEDLRRLSAQKGLSLIGILNDDSSYIGVRHLAYVFRYEASNSVEWENPKKGETSITRLRWIDPTKIDPKKIDSPKKGIALRDFEYWSQLVLRKFYPSIVESQPSYKIRRKSRFSGKHTLCIIGGVGSGKSVATKILIDEYGYTQINSGKIIADILGIPPVPVTSREEFQKVAWDFITKPNGPARLAKRLAAEVEKCASEKTIIDGIRQIRTLNAIKQNIEHVAVLYVHTPPDLAYSFYKERERKDCTHDEFLHILTAPVEQDIPILISEADAVLYNWIGESRYKEAVRELVRDVSSK